VSSSRAKALVRQTVRPALRILLAGATATEQTLSGQLLTDTPLRRAAASVYVRVIARNWA
jgi:hypothetical protein